MPWLSVRHALKDAAIVTADTVVLMLWLLQTLKETGQAFGLKDRAIRWPLRSDYTVYEQVYSSERLYRCTDRETLM